EPVSYLEMLALTRHAAAVLTDSGGLQKEAYWLGIPSLTLRGETEWPELVESGWTRLVGLMPDDLGGQVKQMLAAKPRQHTPLLYGDGHAAEYIVRHLAGG